MDFSDIFISALVDSLSKEADLSEALQKRREAMRAKAAEGRDYYFQEGAPQAGKAGDLPGEIAERAAKAPVKELMKETPAAAAAGGAAPPPTPPAGGGPGKPPEAPPAAGAAPAAAAGGAAPPPGGGWLEKLKSPIKTGKEMWGKATPLQKGLAVGVPGTAAAGLTAYGLYRLLRRKQQERQTA